MERRAKQTRLSRDATAQWQASLIWKQRFYIRPGPEGKLLQLKVIKHKPLTEYL